MEKEIAYSKFQYWLRKYKEDQRIGQGKTPFQALWLEIDNNLAENAIRPVARREELPLCRA